MFLINNTDDIMIGNQRKIIKRTVSKLQSSNKDFLRSFLYLCSIKTQPPPSGQSSVQPARIRI